VVVGVFFNAYFCWDVLGRFECIATACSLLIFLNLKPLEEKFIIYRARTKRVRVLPVIFIAGDDIDEVCLGDVCTKIKKRNIRKMRDATRETPTKHVAAEGLLVELDTGSDTSPCQGRVSDFSGYCEADHQSHKRQP